MTTKICSKCDIEKSLTEFSKRNDCESGFRAKCKKCRKIIEKKYLIKNSDRIKQKSKLYNDSCKEQKRLYDKNYRINNITKIKKYRKENKNLINFFVNKRKKHIKKATPLWADIKIIKDIYCNRPEGYHVDHIIPLKGENVSGLHVPENLQYLTAEENIRKSNKYYAV